MRAESNVRPEEIIIEPTERGMCDVVLNDNISNELTRVGMDEESTSTYFEYDSYRFELKWRSSLFNEIKSNKEKWLAYAKEAETAPKDLTDKEKIEQLMKANQKLMEDNALLMEDNELLKGCVMEIADVVYA